MTRHGKAKHSRTSIRILIGIVILIWIVVTGRIFQLQILDYETYSPISRQNHIRQEFVTPARGLIRDRNEIILVENEPIYSITIIPSRFDMSKAPLLADLLETDQENLLERIREAQVYSWDRTSRLYTEVSFEVFSNIQENIWQLPGIGHTIESKRHYNEDVMASHAFGYLREASPEDHERYPRLRMGDKVGKSGIELVYEDYLRGELGTEYLRVNAYGQSLGSYNEGELNQPPQKGHELVTTLDAGLQRLTEQLFVGKKGGAVAMDPRNGEILAIVSSPQFDISRLAGRLDREYWQEINADRDTPLFNRAISSRQPPGSTFKPFMGLFGLQTGLITPETVIHNPGYYYRGRPYLDEAAIGDYDLEGALTYSSNTYFFWMMDRIATRGYFNEWSRMMKDFGMGIQNDVDLPHETPGLIPDSTYMNRTYGGERNWGVGDLMSLGVGQGLVSVSPLQMAVATSVIANGGYRVQPHLVRSVRDRDGNESFTNPSREKIEWIREDHLAIVQNGMRRVVTEGSGRYYAFPDTSAAGKTGTAQNPHGENHGWYIMYAPAENPEIAIAVLVENAGFGSQSAAPIASLMQEQFFTGEVNRAFLLNRVLNFQPATEE